MMSGSATRQPTQPAAPVGQLPQQALRLRMKPTGSTTGHVDGAWWPRSRDLAAELPALIEALAARLGRIERVSYHLDDWEPAALRIRVAGHPVRLGGFRAQAEHTVDVSAAMWRRVTVLVVPPETPSVVAEQLLSATAERDNTRTASELITGGGVGTTETPHDIPDAAERRWDTDGGHLDERP
jgi:hypothetical protein